MYWDGDMDGEMKIGECHRFPPVFVNVSEIYCEEWRQPMVNALLTRCGEYKENKV
jgi:hypothetical protein